MTEPVTPEMKAVADALLSWIGTSRFGASDVLIWKSKRGIGIAFRGDALRIQHAVLDTEREMMNNSTFHRGEHLGFLDKSLQQAVGVEVGQRMSTPDEVYSEVLSAVDSVVAEKLGVDDVQSTLMPNEGAPWVIGSRETPYYSAKKRKVLVTEAPKWALEGTWRDQSEDHRGLIADVCSLSSILESERTGDAIVGTLKGVSFFSSHSFGVGRRGSAEEAIASIKKCGGLLYPSLAVGHLPASIFGPITLFTDVRLPLLSVKPYKEGRGRYPVVLYGHDVWTATTSHFVSWHARQLFLQLTGNLDGHVPQSMAVLGPEVAEGGVGGMGAVESDKSPMVATTSKLGGLLAKRFKIWNAKVADVQALASQWYNQPERYPYLEAKVHARLPMSMFRLAAAPVPLKDEALRFLRAVGYEGPLALVEMGDVPLDLITERLNDQAIYRYAWAMRRAVLEVVAKTPRMTVAVVT